MLRNQGWIRFVTIFAMVSRRDGSSNLAFKMSSYSLEEDVLEVSPDDRRLLIESGLFDAKWYSHKYPDVAMVGMDAVEHYLWLGASLGRDPSEHFSTVGYLSAHSDVAAAGTNPLLHYVRW